MKQYNNILAYALVNLGDVVLVTSALALLRQAYPAAKITLLVKSAVKEAVLNNSVIDEVIELNYTAKKKSLGQMRRVLRYIRKQHFDLAVSFDRKLRPALLAWLAGIPVRVGPSKVFDAKPSRVTMLYTDVVPIAADLEHRLQRETYQDIVRHITGQTASAMPVMANIEALNRHKAKKLLDKLGTAPKYIALCVKGTFALKTWPKEYFAELVKHLFALYQAAFFVVGAPGDKTYAAEVITAIKVAVDDDNLVIANFCGETNLPDLAALIDAADLFVTVDTGATHIAATQGKPMVVMYGCTHPDRWHPANERAVVLSSYEPCCPCSYRPEECPSWPQPACLYNVTPGIVLAACQKLLLPDNHEAAL